MRNCSRNLRDGLRHIDRKIRRHEMTAMVVTGVIEGVAMEVAIVDEVGEAGEEGGGKCEAREHAWSLWQDLRIELNDGERWLHLTAFGWAPCSNYDTQSVTLPAPVRLMRH